MRVSIRWLPPGAGVLYVWVGVGGWDGVWVTWLDAAAAATATWHLIKSFKIELEF